MLLTWLFPEPATKSYVIWGRTWILMTLILFILSWVTLAQAAFDPVALVTAARNDEFGKVQAQLNAMGSLEKDYLRRYATVLIPAVARVGSPNAITALVNALGTDTSKIQPALDKALVIAFDNPNFYPMVEQLLVLGASPSTRILGHTALARAAFIHAYRGETSALDAIRTLLAKGADSNTAEDSGMSPLLWACSSNDQPLIKILVSAGAKLNSRISNGRVITVMNNPICAKLPKSANLHFGANKPVLQPPTTSHLQDPLLIKSIKQAIISGDLEQSTALIKQGISANTIVDKITGKSLLMLAKDIKIFRMLLANGADVEWVDTQGWSVLQQLVTTPGTVELVKILLDAGANIQHCIDNGQNALLLTHLLFVEQLDAKSGQQILRLLVQANADINAGDIDGETLLHLAAYNDAKDLAQIALELGADLQLPNARGETPILLATRLQNKKVLEVFTQYLSVKAEPKL